MKASDAKHTRRSRLLTLIHLIVGIPLLSFYGVCTCVHVVKAPTATTMLDVASVLIPLMVLKVLLVPKLVETCPLQKRAFRQFSVEVGVHFIAGVVLAVMNSIRHDYPFKSGLIVFAGVTCWGVLAGIDHALMRERVWLQDHSELDALPAKASSLTKRLWVGGGLLMFFFGLVLFLAVFQDMQILFEDMGMQSMAEGMSQIGMDDISPQILVDFVVGALIFLGFGIRLTWSFSENMRVLFKRQLDALANIERGTLETRVPVKSSDEFGVIAEHTNKMIKGLRERAKLRERFGKVVSPGIAERLTQRDTHVLRAGERIKVAILFTDLRDFTSITEHSTPEELLQILNAYLTHVSNIVYANHGYVEKYIGDAVLAIFGMDGGTNACRNAYQAATQMAGPFTGLRGPKGIQVRCGVGVHFGEVAAGVIGPDDRYEFTVIGDSVNTGARVEWMTKQLGQTVLFSGEVVDQLSPEERASLSDMGEHQVKGRDQPVRLYGLGSEIDAGAGAATAATDK